MYPIYGIYILIAIATAVSFLDNALYFESIEVNRDKYSMDWAVNAASDAAVMHLKDTTQITPSGNVYVDPEFVWKIYKYTFLRSNGVWSEANMKSVEASFPSVMITVNDGYYMRLLVDEEGPNGRVKNYRFTQKMPFARTTLIDTSTSGDANNTHPNLIPAGSVVSDTMDGTNIVVYREGNKVGGYNREYEIYQTDGNKLNSHLGSAHDLTDINKMILQGLDYMMYYNGSKQGSSESGKLMIPDQVSSDLLSPSVAFVGPTIFAFSDNFNLKGKSYLNYYSVGGSQVVDAVNYYSYTRGGIKYYSRLDPTTPAGIARGQATGNNYQESFRTAREAAEAGYRPDPIYY